MKIATRFALPALVLVAVLVAAGCGGSDDDVPADAVAVVDGTPISKTQLDSLLARARTSYQAQQRDFPKAGTPEYQSLQTQAVAFLVQRAEYDSEAATRGIEITEGDVDKRIDQLKRQFFAGDQKRLDEQLKLQGYTAPEFRADVRAQIVSEKLVAQVTAEVKVSDVEARAYYAQNKGQYTVPETRDVRHILVKTKAEADRLYEQIKAGGDFAALAKQHSEDPGSKDSGGKLTVARGQTVAPFDKTAFLLDEGVVSRPVKTQFGYHLIEPLGNVKQGRVTPYADVASQIKSQLRQTERNDAITAWASDIRDKYESKVAYATAYAPPDLTPPEPQPAPGGHSGANGNS